MKLAHLVLPFLLSSCVDSPEAPDEELGETSQEISSILNAYTCSDPASCSFNLGTASNRACFIAGIRGFAMNSYSFISADFGNHVLTIYPHVAAPMTVTTTCVTTSSPITTAHWNTNVGPAIQIPNTTPSSRCFLTTVGAQAGGLTHATDTVGTFRDTNGNWFIGGAAVGSSWMSGSAVCFDAINHSEWGWTQGAGTITGNLSANPNHDVACGLTRIGGVFTNSATTDGVFLGFTSKLKTQWMWTLANYKHGTANCIK